MMNSKKPSDELTEFVGDYLDSCPNCKKQAEQIADYDNQYDSLNSIIGNLERRLEYKDNEIERLKSDIVHIRAGYDKREDILKAENNRLKELVEKSIQGFHANGLHAVAEWIELDYKAAPPQKGDSDET